jgi:CBS domain-containing protein
MKIRELMVENIISVPSNASVHEAVRLMNKNGIGCLLVVDSISGILTERDVLERIVEKGKNPRETEVSKIMTKHVTVGTPDMELVDATKLMFEKNVKKLPIVEGGKLIGLVTMTDIARGRARKMETSKKNKEEKMRKKIGKLLKKHDS